MAPRSRHPRTKHLALTLVLTIVGGLVVSAGLVIVTLVLATNISDSALRNKEAANTAVTTALTEEQAFTLPENTSNVPELLDESTLVDVVAKNQPAVVRILSIYCADISVSVGGAGFSQDDACSAGVGSGSIISRDGYIATNGHVAIVTPKQAIIGSLDSISEVKRYLTFLIDAKLMAVADANTLLNNVIKGTDGAEDELAATVEQIASSQVVASDIDTIYAIQLSNEPVRLDRTGARYSVEFDSTIVRAVLVDKDFDPDAAEKSLQTGQFTTSDVALLKASGDFPYVTLGDISGVERGDQLTAIGFPAFIDGSVDTDQWQTVPSVTQGKVRDVGTDADVNGRVLLSTSVQIAQGNSGGPSFNDAGEQIGINTYSDLQCQDLKCYGDGLVRDIADLKKLLERNNITLEKGGVTDDWANGLDAYTAGNYTEALNLFTKVKQEYPANYLVSSMSRLAREQSGTPSDTSGTVQAQSTITIVLVLIGLIVVVIAATTTFLIIYFNYRHRQTLSGS